MMLLVYKSKTDANGDDDDNNNNNNNNNRITYTVD